MIALIDIAHFLFNDLAPELKISHNAASAKNYLLYTMIYLALGKIALMLVVFYSKVQVIVLPELQSISIFPSGLTANFRPTACLASAILF